MRQYIRHLFVSAGYFIFYLHCFSADGVVLSWSDNSTDELGFKIERAVGDGPFLQIDSIPAETISYTDTKVVRGVEYSYRIRAFNQAGDSPYSNVARGGYISRITNMSILTSDVGSGNPLTVGFVTSGSSPKSVLVRAVGPSLSSFGVEGALGDPILSLYSGPKVVAINDDWGADGAAPQIAAANRSVGAFPLGESGRDAALLIQLKSGAYSAELSGKDPLPGFALIEVYDQDSIYATRIVNVSALREVGSETKALTVGFVISGSNSKRILIRAVGPTLATSPYNVPGTLRDPRILLFRAGLIEPMAQNDDWGGTDLLKEAFKATAAFALGDNSLDSALAITLPPGEYTVEVSGPTGQTGMALVEVYEVPSDRANGSQ